MSDESGRPPRIRLAAVLVGVLAVVIATGAIVWFFVLPDDDDPVADLADDAGTGEAVDVTTLDGTWTVVPGPSGEGTFAGYLVDEVFASGLREATAAGRTADVEGELVVLDGTVTTASITVDMTTLTSDEGRRDAQIRERGIETDRFPEATFELTEPIPLPDDLADGAVATVSATGDLTLHGVTRSITTDLDVRPLGSEFTVLARVPIDFADHDIEAPSIGGFVEVRDEGRIELRVNFGRT